MHGGYRRAGSGLRDAVFDIAFVGSVSLDKLGDSVADAIWDAIAQRVEPKPSLLRKPYRQEDRWRDLDRLQLEPEVVRLHLLATRTCLSVGVFHLDRLPGP